jgi:hypothetical protein
MAYLVMMAVLLDRWLRETCWEMKVLNSLASSVLWRIRKLCENERNRFDYYTSKLRPTVVDGEWLRLVDVLIQSQFFLMACGPILVRTTVW